MFESATTLNIEHGRLDESLAILRERVVPILLAQPGLLSLAVVPQTGHSRVSLVSIWKSLAHAQAVEFNPRYRQAIQKLDPLLVDEVADSHTGDWQPAFKMKVRSRN
jgi:quinol monooxygenase YgiN